VGRIQVDRKLNNFCLDSKGRVLACCDDSKIRVFAADGKLVDTWELDFMPQAIALRGKDGNVFVGGSGQLAQLSAGGSTIAQKAFPRPMTEEELDDAVQAQVESQAEMFESYLRGLRGQLTEISKALGEQPEEAGEPDADTRRRSADDSGYSYISGMSSGEDGLRVQFKPDTPLDKQVAAVKMYLNSIEQQYGNREKLEESIRRRMKTASSSSTFTGMAVAEDDLFVICSGPGYSYNAWRTTHNLEEAKLIVKGLRGCCGQMDCQTHDGDLWIAMNTKHKVIRYNRDGKELASFGKYDREAADGFGGCCEPKNMRFAADGYVYCAESGPPVCVKRFSSDGQFQNVVCFPVYETGCVRVSVDMAEGKVFLMSPNESAVYIFAPSQEG
jgi:hypothetical protein